MRAYTVPANPPDDAYVEEGIEVTFDRRGQRQVILLGTGDRPWNLNLDRRNLPTIDDDRRLRRVSIRRVQRNRQTFTEVAAEDPNDERANWIVVRVIRSMWTTEGEIDEVAWGRGADADGFRWRDCVVEVAPEARLMIFPKSGPWFAVSNEDGEARTLRY